MKKHALLALSLMTLSACAPVQNTNGIYLGPDDVAKIEIGQTRENVLQTLGTPSTTAVFDDNVWYYVGQKTEKKAFFDTKVTDRRVFEAKFTDDGTLYSFAQLDGEAVDVPLVRKKTPTSGHDLTAAQQLLGNLGRFNKSSKGGTPGAN